MIKEAALGLLSGLIVVGGVASPTVLVAGCTKQQAAAAVQLTVDACQEIANFVPPSTAVGSVVGLVCQTVDQLAPAVEIVIDSSVWNAMKANYLKSHAALPRGMSPLPVSYPMSAVPLPDAKKP